MKKINITLKNIALTILTFIGLLACDKDFASLESDVVNSDNTTNFDTGKAIYSVITYNKKVTPFRSNGLPSNLLGYYNDPVFGTSSANFVSQMSPTTFDPSFGNNIVLDSVILTIPYFSTGTDTDTDGNITYRLDSIYGNAPIKLSVFQNNYFLRSFNPESEFNNSQKYYSNGATSETSLIDPLELEGRLLYEDDAFLPSKEQILLTTTDDDGEVTETAKIAPALRVNLYDPLDPSDTFWQELIFDKEGEPELSNQNNFINYFRGLYIKTAAIGIDGSMMLINFANTNANITLYYTSDVEDSDTNTDSEVTEQEGTFILNFSGNLVNIFDNNFITIPDGDTVNGDEKLFLKGGEGSMAIISLFNGDDDEFADFLDDFKDGTNPKRLVNEAYLEFYVDQSTVQGQEPNRVYLYDIENKTALIDYFIDQSVSDLTINAKIEHLEPLVRVGDDPDGEGVKYKIRITEHINNLIVRDSTNVKLGLVVTSNVGSIDPYGILGKNDEILPSGTILSPKGTVLFGNNTTNEDKKVKLTIYYTEPEN